MRRTCIALLRGINVGGRARVGMADLRSLCEAIGWLDVRTYIQSGNVVFRASPGRDVLEEQLEEAITKSLGFSPAVIVRSAQDWSEYLRSNPFAAEAASSPNRVMLALSKSPPVESALAVLRKRAGSERLERIRDSLWIHYPAGVGKSRLTPGMLDTAVGSPTTMRNWRTVVKLGELANA